MTAQFTDYPLQLLQPAFDSPLTDIIIELEHLRRLEVSGSTPPAVFFQLKNIFHFLESLGSARIEGNHTTLADFIESKIESPQNPDDQLQEILNIEKAMQYVEKTVVPEEPISELLIRELHQIAVTNLDREGDPTPGQYRTTKVAIMGSQHNPPDQVTVSGYMKELVDFINRTDPPKYDLLKMALAHHRFSWVHPFRNGNGRTVRLLSYVMLIKFGFNVSAAERILNPTAVFCSNRDDYYLNLSAADSGQNSGLETWCLYALKGIRTELEKVNNLANYDYLKKEILYPALASSKERGLVSPQEASILYMGITNGTFKADDISHSLPEITIRQRTAIIQKLIKNKMIEATKPKGRTYSISFTNNYLLRGVIKLLEEKEFITQLIRQN